MIRLSMNCLLVVVFFLAFPAYAQNESDTNSWPSEWGADDERGAANRITSASVLDAVRLIQEGKIYELGRDYEEGMPVFPGRHFSLTIRGNPHLGRGEENDLVAHEEMISGQLGQVGTQFDGLGHIGVIKNGEGVFYNGFKRSEFGTSHGLEKLGVEKAGVFLARGVLIDVAKYKGVDRLSVGEVITVADLQGALRRQSTVIKEGDVVLMHTGHGQLWMVDNEEYNSGGPGIGIEAAIWLADQKIIMTGADTFPGEVRPGAAPNISWPVHRELIGKRGIYNFENLDLSALANDGVYEFAFIFAPVKFKGATGSPGNPIAVR